MNINDRGLKAIRQLRIDLEEAVGVDFPHACLSELLLLHDVCTYLELSNFQTQEILGAFGFLYVDQHINRAIELEPYSVDQCLDRANILN